MDTTSYTPHQTFDCQNVVFTATNEKGQEVVVKVKPVKQNDLNRETLSEGICYVDLQYRFLMHHYRWKIFPIKDPPFPSSYLFPLQQRRESFSTIQVLEFEYYKGGNLIEFVHKHTLTMEQKKIIFVNILLGLDFIHSNHYVHCDIKPQNILVKLMKLLSDKNAQGEDLQFDAVIADFGSMQKLPPGKKSTPLGEYTKFDISVTNVRLSFL